MTSPIVLHLADHEVRVTHPDKLYVPAAKLAKIDLARYYAEVAEPLLDASRNRPLVLKRYPDGIDGEHFYQKRAPKHRPAWIQTATYRFPSGRSADEIVLADAAHLVWIANLGAIEIHAHPVRADDLDHPDELRVDLDPVPGVDFDDVRRVALLVREILEEHELVGFPKTSGGRGMHVYAPIERRWEAGEVRRAALALAREAARRAPELATSKWWKEERHGVFVDYNQNARDRTMAAAYSVRPTADARVSAPLSWDEVAGCDPAAFTVATMPARLAERGCPWRGHRDHEGSLDALLATAARQEEAGEHDAAWPPHHPKGKDEPSRAPPSRRRKPH